MPALDTIANPRLCKFVSSPASASMRQNGGNEPCAQTRDRVEPARVQEICPTTLHVSVKYRTLLLPILAISTTHVCGSIGCISARFRDQGRRETPHEEASLLRKNCTGEQSCFRWQLSTRRFLANSLVLAQLFAALRLEGILHGMHGLG